MRRIVWQLIASLVLAANAAAAAVAQAENACVVLVLDSSGSMAENDPAFLRNAGAKMLISVLDDGDAVGIVRFASSAELLTPEMVILESPAAKRNLFALLADQPPDGYTDMKAGLERAGALLQNATCSTRAVVVLSDGRPELPNGLPEGYMEGTLAAGRLLDAPVFGIALTASGESGLLFQLANLREDGRVIPAANAAALLDAYLEVVAHLKDRTVVGAGAVAASGTVTLPLEPALAPYVDRATLVVAHQGASQASWLAPGGGGLDPTTARISFVHNEQTFQVATVEDPAPGEWQAQIAGSGQSQVRLILRSRLRVAADMPPVHPLGEPLVVAARLVEAQNGGGETTLIGQGTFTAEIERPDGSRDAIDRLVDDGQAGDRLASDGHFSFMYVRTDLPGVYTITFTGYKGVVPARQTARVAVVAFPTIELAAPKGAVEVRGEPVAVLAHLAGGNPPTLDSGRLSLEIVDPSGQVSEMALELSGESWQSGWSPVVDGPHTLRVIPEEGIYKGVPYTIVAEREVQVTLIPALSPAVDSIELDGVEVHELETGIDVSLPLSSSSRVAETLSAELAGLPGLVISGVTPDQVAPGSSTLHITVQGKVEPSRYQATLLLAGRDGLEIVGRAIALTLDVYQPAVTFSETALELGDIRSDRQARQPIVTEITVASASQRDESLELVWEGPAGVALIGGPIVVPAGQTVRPALEWRLSGLALGEHSGVLRPVGRPGLRLAPAELTATVIVVAPPWCARYCLPLGALAGALTGGAVGLTAAWRRRPRPWGTLTLTRGPAGHNCPPLVVVRSSFSHPAEMRVGSGPGNELRLSGGSVEPLHATIVGSQETMVQTVPGRPPRQFRRPARVSRLVNRGQGVVRLNGAAILPHQRSAALAPGAKVQVGDYHFEWSG